MIDNSVNLELIPSCLCNAIYYKNVENEKGHVYSGISYYNYATLERDRAGHYILRTVLENIPIIPRFK